MSKKQITPEEAQRIIQEEQQKKQEAFLKEYKELCEKHGMELVAVPALNIADLRH